MVGKKIQQPEMRTMYLLKPGQTLENIKASERTRALIVTKDTFQRFVDYTTEEDRIVAQQEREAAKIAALKKATYEKSETWHVTIKNIKARQREELLSKRQKAEEERKVFVKEMTEKKLAERAEVVQQARRLLQQKRPLCRQINRALLVSECLRELDDQVAFQKTIRAMDKEQDIKYASMIMTDVVKDEEQKKQETKKQMKKIRDYRTALIKQLEENERDSKLKVMEEMEAEKQEQKNMTREIQLTKEKEMQDLLNKKKRFQRFFEEAIEEKKRLELELKHNDELEDRALEVYREAKDRIQKIHKSLALKEKEEKARQTQIIVGQHVSSEQAREAKEREILKKAVEEKEVAEAEKRKAQKEREEKMRALMEEYKLHDAAVKTKLRQEEKELKAWEMMQRFKRDEYDKQTNLEERKRQWQEKLEYRNELQKDIEERRTEKEREKEVLEAEATKAAERANQRILLYSNEVLEESKGARPLYPIVKAIEEIKKEMGLTPNKKKFEVNLESTVEAERPKRKYRARRCTCPKPVLVDQMYYLQ
ncbi:PREDICTED: calponin homology domain-containing protein DDB_G0272472-like [Wasmannia auropunctata]|uniref:calponin homology domain-containing protein DDB_G0272472-like n=1 Tax=Wasmannia auropunctata TaxID=64793 RepID=UPI0005EE6665|nr:PREDICTED: calponin homology domain-containing protein DDB_G0272472-like [Wasmannia auropunctata]